MNRQFADQVANRVRAEIDIGQSPITAYGQRRVTVLEEGAGWPGLASGR